MKKLLLFLLGIILLTAAHTQESSIIIKGSDTVLPLSKKLSEAYMKRNKDENIIVSGGGSGIGISALAEGTTDIAQSSRELKSDEVNKLNLVSSGYKKIVIALDALAVIVNPSVKIDRLTREQVQGIFTGQITNWKEIGGDDLQIVVFGRESNSGTFEFFREHVMNNNNYTPDILIMPESNAITQMVHQTPGAIGYIGMAYVESGVKTVSISYDNGNTFIPPSLSATKDGTYPVVRSLYFFYTENLEEKVKTFVSFALSSEGQRIVQEVGYVPISLPVGE
jgi:phosphate transport system substrate-binding protein